MSLEAWTPNNNGRPGEVECEGQPILRDGRPLYDQLGVFLRYDPDGRRFVGKTRDGETVCLTEIYRQKRSFQLAVEDIGDVLRNLIPGSR